MPFTNLKLWALAAVVSLSGLSAMAEEGGGEKPAGGAEVPKDQREFSEKSAKLSVLQNHIEDADKRFKELVHEKEEARTAASKQAVIKEMVELTKQRNLDVSAMNKLKSDLSYRYPDAGERSDRTYETQGKRSVEEMEGAAGLDEMLTRTKKQVDRKFAPFQPDDDHAPKLKTAKPSEEDKPKRLKLEK